MSHWNYQGALVWNRLGRPAVEGVMDLSYGLHHNLDHHGAFVYGNVIPVAKEAIIVSSIASYRISDTEKAKCLVLTPCLLLLQRSQGLIPPYQAKALPISG